MFYFLQTEMYLVNNHQGLLPRCYYYHPGVILVLVEVNGYSETTNNNNNNNNNKNPDIEMGVITFNHKQQEKIVEILYEKTLQHNIRIPESFFVKNIENVQGDEKELIIFSIGYAPDEKGKVHLHFGNLNNEGGEKRLNVAITRARKKIIIISSIKPQQMNTDHVKNKGPILLKKYLEYAWEVSQNKKHVPIKDTTPKSLQWLLLNKIKEKGFIKWENIHFMQNIPQVDLVAMKNDQYIGVILTDDDYYYQSLSSKQVYNNQYFHLNIKNWPYIQIHSREFWINPEAVQVKITQFLSKHVAKS